MDASKCLTVYFWKFSHQQRVLPGFEIQPESIRVVQGALCCALICWRLRSAVTYLCDVGLITLVGTDSADLSLSATSYIVFYTVRESSHVTFSTSMLALCRFIVQGCLCSGLNESSCSLVVDNQRTDFLMALYGLSYLFMSYHELIYHITVSCHIASCYVT